MGTSRCPRGCGMRNDERRIARCPQTKRDTCSQGHIAAQGKARHPARVPDEVLALFHQGHPALSAYDSSLRVQALQGLQRFLCRRLPTLCDQYHEHFPERTVRIRSRESQTALNPFHSTHATHPPSPLTIACILLASTFSSMIMLVVVVRRVAVVGAVIVVTTGAEKVGMGMGVLVVVVVMKVVVMMMMMVLMVIVGVVVHVRHVEGDHRGFRERSEQDCDFSWFGGVFPLPGRRLLRGGAHRYIRV